MSILAENSQLRAVLAGLATAGTGLFLLWASTQFTPADWPLLPSLIRDTGALLIASTALAFLWETASKRAFAREILATVRLSGDVERAGLKNIFNNFNQDLDWTNLIANAKEIDIFFSYGRTWRGTHSVALRDAASKSPRVRVVLPDPDDVVLMRHLESRFRMAHDELPSAIRQAHDDFVRIFATGGKKNRLQIYYTSKPPVHSIYRFGDKAILALYQHRALRGNVPSFLAQQGGWLYSFCKDEFEALMLGDEQIRTRQAFPASGPNDGKSGANQLVPLILSEQPSEQQGPSSDAK